MSGILSLVLISFCLKGLCKSDLLFSELWLHVKEKLDLFIDTLCSMEKMTYTPLLQGEKD